jgi:hypothetical protein
MDYSVFSPVHPFMLSVGRNPKWSTEMIRNMKVKNKAVAFAILCLEIPGSVNLAAQKQDDAELLRAREEGWRAWFAGDTNTLRTWFRQRRS